MAKLTSAKQRTVTLDRIARFEASLAAFDRETRPADTHELLWAAQRSSLVSILDDLREQVREYDRAHPFACLQRLDFLFWLAGGSVILWAVASWFVWPLLLFGIFIPGHVSVMRREWRRANGT